jgi:DNA-binding NtrC family response regulator
MIELPDKPSELPYREAKAEVLKKFEVEYFRAALKRTNGNVSKAADLIGIHRKNFIQKLQALDISPKFPENNI